MSYQGKKDTSGFSPQERHDIIIATLDEFGKTAKCFQLRWRENSGELLDAKILSSTPMFWFMKYKWSRSEIEALFFKARIVIDPIFDMALQQTFGGDPGPRWKGGGGVKKTNWRRTQYEMGQRPWTSPTDEKKEKEDDTMNYHINHPNFEYNPVHQPVDFQATGGVNNKNKDDEKKNYSGNKDWDRLKKKQNDDADKKENVNLKPVPDYSTWKQPTGDDVVPIYVECPDGKTVKLDVRTNEPIHYVKKQIENKTKIPESEQKIFFNNSELKDDNATLNDYGINKDDVLQLTTGPITIFIEDPDGKKYELSNIDPHSSIREVKEEINKLLNIPLNEIKLFSDKKNKTEFYDDNKSLAKYGISNQDTIYLGGKRKKWVSPTGNDVIPVFVETPDGKTVTLNVTPSDPINYVKLQIEHKTNGKYPVSAQKLFFNDNELTNDDSTVADNKIRKNDTLQLSVGTIPIFVETIDGKTISLEVEPHEKIINVKKMINEKENGKLPVEKQKLFNKLNNAALSDDFKSLHNYGITENSTLYLGGTIPIKIRKPDGNVLDLEVDPTHKIQDIKKQINAASNNSFPVKQQTLIYKNNELNDNRPLKFYSVRPSDMIELKVTYPIYIKKPDGKQIKLDVSPTDTISSIKSRIEYNENIPSDAQTLKYKNKDLSDDNKPLSFYNIGENAVISLSVDHDNPEALLEKLMDRDSPANERLNAMNKINDNLGDNKKYDVLLKRDKIPLLICGFATQVLDEDYNKNPVSKTAIQTIPNIFKKALDHGNPSNIAIGQLQETLDALFKIYDDPKCKKQHEYAHNAIDKIVDDVIDKNDPESITVLAGILTEKTRPENITTPHVRKFAAEQLAKIMFPKQNKLIKDIFTEGAKKKKVDEVKENDLPKKGTANREWLDVGTDNKAGPGGNKNIGDEYRDIVSDAISQLILDPNRDNNQIGLNLADVFNQLNPDWKKWLDPHARNRWKNYNFGLKPYSMKLPPKAPKKKYKIEPLKPVDYVIQQQTDVGIAAPALPDI